MKNTLDRVTDKAEGAAAGMSEDMEGIKESFSQLRRDVLDLLGNAFGLGKSGADYAKDGASAAVEAMKSRLLDLKDRGADQVHAVEKRIEDNPITAALIALGVGFVIAKIFSRR